MYTQCPECETYFRVTADDLAAADGEVRCSRCEAIFDARARLLTPAQEDALAEGHAPAAGPGPTDAPRSADAPDEAPGPAPSTDQDIDAIGDGDAGPALDVSTDPAIGDLFEGDAPHDDALVDPATTDPSLDLSLATNAEALDPTRVDPSLSDPALTPDATPGPDADPSFDAGLPRAPLGFELPTGASPLLTAAGRPRPKRGPWLAACGVLALLLALQWLHANREPLARDPRFGQSLQSAYRSLNLPLDAPTDLARLSVQRADVTSHPVYRDVLYITATVTNEAAFAQPLPLLRVRLDDRWGEPVGVRIFRPEEYLRRAEPAARAEPGRPYAIALEVVDPGNEAVGYALTACLPQGETLACLGDG